MRSTRFHLLTLLLAAGVAGPAAAQTDGDQDTQAEAAADAAEAAKPKQKVDLDLDERIKPVSGHLFLKDGRHEFSPTVSLSLNDAFFTKYVVGLRYAYHLSEKWSVGATYGYAFSEPSGAVSKCDSSGQNCELPSKDDLTRAPGNIGSMAGLDVSWAPLYGKISVLAESVLHFDTYAIAGAGVVEAIQAPVGEVKAESAYKPEVHVGLGQRYFLGRHATLRFEVRDMIYATERPGLEAKSETDIQNQLLFSIGLSFFLGS